MVHECLCQCLLDTEADGQLDISSNLDSNGWINGKNVSKPTLLKLKGNQQTFYKARGTSYHVL